MELTPPKSEAWLESAKIPNKDVPDEGLCEKPDIDVKEENPEKSDLGVSEIVRSPEKPDFADSETVRSPEKPDLADSETVRSPEKPDLAVSEIVRSPEKPDLADSETVRSPEKPDLADSGDSETINELGDQLLSLEIHSPDELSGVTRLIVFLI